MNRHGRRYCRGACKRAFDLCVSAILLVALSPLLLILASLILLWSGRPVLFCQERIGKDGRPFRLMKFITMRPGAGRGLQVTARGDPRITRLGRVLRSAKLDELPQLINVLRGDMSLVGPRPEVPRYVAAYSIGQRRVMEVRPGLTDPATILFRDEERLLASVEETRRERFYVEEILPRKLELNLAYIDRASFWSDLGLILRTLGVIVFPGRA